MTTLIRKRAIVNASTPSPDPRDVVRLEPADDPAAVAPRLADVARVEVNFPKFADGRGFSIARLLRERYGYRGELRAVGQVGLDHLHYMEQCGFDAFELRDGEDAEEALAAFDAFSEGYQTSVARPEPLFRRRG
jgi:uncharacterized protein (DUF934 family)